MLNRRYTAQYDTAIVRILLLKTKDSVAISSESPIKMSGAVAQTGDGGSPLKAFVFVPNDIAEAVKIDPGYSPLIMNGQPYRGSIELRSADGTISVINILKIDDYLLSVVPGEIPANWEEEALKAQAVAARTYTYYQLLANRKNQGGFDLEATTNFQVYKGMIDEKPRTTEAVRATSGEIIIYDAKPILSYFHSTCGGKTTDDNYVWNTSHLPYLHGVSCGFCNDSTKFEWESRLSLDEIRNNLSKKYRAVGAIKKISFRKKDDRVIEVYIQHSRGNLKIAGNSFRLLFPPEKVRSLYFTSKKYNAGLALAGHGWGHGVGLCQWGARGMALRGYRYQEILKHYYTAVTVTSVRNGYIASQLKDAFDYQ
jgi:stage II sporulation protein D